MAILGFLVLGESEPPDPAVEWDLQPYDPENAIYQRSPTPLVRRLA